VVGLETSSVTDINVAGDHATARVSVGWSKAPQDDLAEPVESFERTAAGKSVAQQTSRCGSAYA